MLVRQLGLYSHSATSQLCALKQVLDISEPVSSSVEWGQGDHITGQLGELMYVKFLAHRWCLANVAVQCAVGVERQLACG